MTGLNVDNEEEAVLVAEKEEVLFEEAEAVVTLNLTGRFTELREGGCAQNNNNTGNT